MPAGCRQIGRCINCEQRACGLSTALTDLMLCIQGWMPLETRLTQWSRDRLGLGFEFSAVDSTHNWHAPCQK